MSKRSDIPEEAVGSECDVTIIDDAAVADAIASLPTISEIDGLAAGFGALADPTRVRIALALLDRELCVCDLAAIVGISQSGVSHQLRVLRDLRVVSYRRDGRRAVYRLADDHIRKLLHLGLEHATEATRR